MKQMKYVTAVAAFALSMLGLTGSAAAERVKFHDGFTHDREFLCKHTKKATVRSLVGQMTIQVRARGSNLEVWRSGKKTTAKDFCATSTARPLVTVDNYDGGKFGRKNHETTARTMKPAARTLKVNARRIVDPDLAVRLPNGCYQVSSARGITWQGKSLSQWVQCPGVDAYGNSVWNVQGFEKAIGRNEWAILTNTAVGQVGQLATAAAIFGASKESGDGAGSLAQANVKVNVKTSTSNQSAPPACGMCAGNGMD